MKRFLKMLVVWFVCALSPIFSLIGFSSAFDSIHLSDNPQEENTDANIKWAQLIEKYLLNYNEELESFKETHAIRNDETIGKTMEKIQTMIFALRKIQTNKVEKDTATEVMRDAITEIKSINYEVKAYLKTKAELIRQETKLLQRKYETIIEKTSNKLEGIISLLRKNLQKRGNIWENSRKISEALDELEKQNTRLKNFKNMSFSHPNELKETLREILLTIKNEFSDIRMLLK